MVDAQYGLACSSVNLHDKPDVKSSVIEALDPQEQVQVLEDVGEMYKVNVTKWHHPLPGYVLKSALVIDPGNREFFPRLELKPGLSIASVPPSIPLAAFLPWLDSGKESPWLPADYLDLVQSGQKPSPGDAIRQAISALRADWDSWANEVKSNGRLASATIDEFLVIMAGGRTMWTIRAERLFTEPSIHAAAPAWLFPLDIPRWTGHVRFNDQEPKYKLWYELEFTKLDRHFKGWYKASLLEEFFIPTPDTDVTDPDNQKTVFDLSRPRLRMPMDPEIDAARKAGRTAAQYIEVGRAIGNAAVKHNLCGEFCVAALGGSDVIPFLRRWLASYTRAMTTLQNDWGTSIYDLQSMLDAIGKKYELFRAEGSIAPITPGYVRKMLDTGRMAIVGTGINYLGAIRCGSRTRHWIVIEDILRVRDSGWVRIYNPFSDREEVYPFNVVFNTISRSAIGMWVEPTPPASSSSQTLLPT
jgi:hypothetical protein